jgi:hypothetical protein
MDWMGIGKKILDKLSDKQYIQLNKICDLIKYNYQIKVTSEVKLTEKVNSIIAEALTCKPDTYTEFSEKIVNLCREYYTRNK